jgi:hypothetical protein
MFTPDITLAALKTMYDRWGDKIYGRYSFADAFNPNNGWVNPDVIGIDLGITLLSAENLRTGNVWRWFMRNKEIPRALQLAGFRRARRVRPQKAQKARKKVVVLNPVSCASCGAFSERRPGSVLRAGLRSWGQPSL